MRYCEHIKKFLPPENATPDDVLAWAERQGVDIEKLKERLRMTPAERLGRHQQELDRMFELRNSSPIERRSRRELSRESRLNTLRELLTTIRGCGKFNSHEFRPLV